MRMSMTSISPSSLGRGGGSLTETSHLSSDSSYNTFTRYNIQIRAPEMLTMLQRRLSVPELPRPAAHAPVPVPGKLSQSCYTSCHSCHAVLGPRPDQGGHQHSHRDGASQDGGHRL